MKTEFYSISMGSGYGVFFLDTSSKERVKQEIENLPEGWHINIWLIGADEVPIRQCRTEEF